MIRPKPVPSHRPFAIGILVLGSIPVLAVAATFVASVLTYDPERERCFNAGIGGHFICTAWYEECQRKLGCNFATYWRELLPAWEAQVLAPRAQSIGCTAP